jgi:hypothetical protein
MLIEILFTRLAKETAMTVSEPKIRLSVIFYLFKAIGGCSEREPALNLKETRKKFRVPEDAWGFRLIKEYEASVKDGHHNIKMYARLESPTVYYGGEYYDAERVQDELREPSAESTEERRQVLREVRRNMEDRLRLRAVRKIMENDRRDKPMTVAIPLPKTSESVFAVEIKKDHFEISGEGEVWLDPSVTRFVDIREILEELNKSLKQRV